MYDLNLIGALCGLCGAVRNNGRTADTDRVVREALLCEDPQGQTELIRREKFAVSPGCETCPNPCGNTSDYDMSRLGHDDPGLRALKLRIVDDVRALAARYGDQLPDVIYKAISYIGFELTADQYQQLLEEINA